MNDVCRAKICRAFSNDVSTSGRGATATCSITAGSKKIRAAGCRTVEWCRDFPASLLLNRSRLSCPPKPLRDFPTSLRFEFFYSNFLLLDMRKRGQKSLLPCSANVPLQVMKCEARDNKRTSGCVAEPRRAVSLSQEIAISQVSCALLQC